MNELSSKKQGVFSKRKTSFLHTVFCSSITIPKKEKIDRLAKFEHSKKNTANAEVVNKEPNFSFWDYWIEANNS